jgi:hypothetical protein
MSPLNASDHAVRRAHLKVTLIPPLCDAFGVLLDPKLYRIEAIMSEKPNQPAYRAASETAQAELSQIVDRLNQLRTRHEQISTAVQALKLLVGAHEAAASAGKSVYTMNGAAAQPAKLKALA